MKSLFPFIVQYAVSFLSTEKWSLVVSRIRHPLGTTNLFACTAEAFQRMFTWSIPLISWSKDKSMVPLVQMLSNKCLFGYSQSNTLDHFILMEGSFHCSSYATLIYYHTLYTQCHLEIFLYCIIHAITGFCITAELADSIYYGPNCCIVLVP